MKHALLPGGRTRDVVALVVTKVEDRIIVAHIWPPRGHRIRPSQFRVILTGVNARQASCIYQIRTTPRLGTTCRPNNAIGLNFSFVRRQS